MFKTIQECRLELVAHTAKVNHHDMVAPEEYTVQAASVDLFPCSAARVSFGNEDKTGKDLEKDKKLMKYLADHQHMTPFEHQSATFLVEVPLFIRSQIMRHRTFAYNEISRRYTDENLEFWCPDVWRGQAKNNRQASEGKLAWPERLYGTGGKNGHDLPYEDAIELALESYEWLIANGYSREQARSVLPQSLLTKFYMTGNLRNWVHFINLRKDGHAQKEVQVVAERIEAELRKLWPNSVRALLG